MTILKKKKRRKKMKPKFNTDFEYDEWFEEKNKQKILDNYFGKKWRDKHDKQGRSKENF